MARTKNTGSELVRAICDYLALRRHFFGGKTPLAFTGMAAFSRFPNILCAAFLTSSSFAGDDLSASKLNLARADSLLIKQILLGNAYATAANTSSRVGIDDVQAAGCKGSPPVLKFL
jgi:hypothetical protein